MQNTLKTFICILFFSGFIFDSQAQNLIQGSLEVCSGSTGQYTILGYSGYGFQWSVIGGTIESGQGTGILSVSWLRNSTAQLTVIAKDPVNSTYLYDTARITVDTSCVWPGDANHDHKVSYTDLLVIGEAFGKTHVQCIDTSTQWEAQARCNWGDTTGLGLELKHVDCNGDGVINSDDTNAIIRNYSQADVLLCPPPVMGDPELRIFTGADTIYSGHVVYASVYFGNTIQPVLDAYGVAFSLTYDPEIFDATSPQFDFTWQWLTAGCKNPIIFYRNFPDEGRIDFAFSRTDHTYLTDGGEMVKIKFKVKDKIPTNKTMSKFTLGEFQFISKGGPLKAVLRTNDSSAVVNTTGIEHDWNLSPQVYIYPNPAHGEIQVNCSSPISRINVFNELGMSMLNTYYSGNASAQKLALPENLHGIYFLEITDKNGYSARKKVMVE